MKQNHLVQNHLAQKHLVQNHLVQNFLVQIILVLVTLFLMAISVSAQTPSFGVGFFGGVNYPIVQDDQGNGSAFGFLARFKVLPMVAIEPNITFGKWGKPDPIEGIDLGIDGSRITSFGIDLTLGSGLGKLGFKPYFHGGIASYKIENDATGYDQTKVGVSGGFGFAFGISPAFDIDIRGKAVIAPQEKGSKKAVLVTGGINFYPGAN